jgi:hypothetical protein
LPVLDRGSGEARGRYSGRDPPDLSQGQIRRLRSRRNDRAGRTVNDVQVWLTAYRQSAGEAPNNLPEADQNSLSGVLHYYVLNHGHAN